MELATALAASPEADKCDACQQLEFVHTAISSFV
jgi:hypothetical protein